MNDSGGPIVPSATYRLQLRPGFGFDEAAAVAPYLRRLGVSHVYSSPYLQAAPGSQHGYDVVDPRRVNRELGGEEGYRRFCDALGRSGLGQVLDIVPNHMAISGPENPWWLDVLENGPSSRYAPYFDVDWDPPETYLRDRVLLPILADHYGEVLEAGGLSIGRREGELVLCYEDHRLPIAPRSLDVLLADAAVRAGSDDLAFIADGYGRLPPSTAIDRPSVERRHRDKEVLRRQLARLIAEEPAIGPAIDEAVGDVNRRPEALDELLSRQNYRLAYWRTAERDLGYRRFFDVSTLIGLRTEDEAVFEDTHGLVLGWVAAGAIDGLRIDHPDGLRDPAAYMRRLREHAPSAWIVAEKILGHGESLRADWPIAGTTGYDFLGLVGGLFVDGGSETAMTRTFTEFTGIEQPFASVARDGKLLVLRDVLGSELNRLTALLLEICESHRRYRDYTRHECHEVLREIAAAFPVYRSYVRAEAGHIDPTDEAAIEEAIVAAVAERPDLEPRLFEFVRDILTLRVGGDREHELVMRFQQLTGAVMAKGIEDTAFYRYLRLTSLTEVGGDPAVFGTDVAAFHAANEQRLEHWPGGMLTTATHDTKRGEDTRLRISMLSEIPEPWRAAVSRWSGLLERYLRDDRLDRATEYLLYQTLVGTWPIGPDRLVPYLRKAVREAKVHTSWSAPDEAYEEAVATFAEAAVTDASFVADLEAFLVPLIPAARVSSLAQRLLTLTAPGVPDVYQGTETWDLSLVDPDNRRAVDFTALDRLLASLDGSGPEVILERMDEGAPKLWVLRQALAVRRDRPAAFSASSTYEPITATGARADHLVGYVRGGEVAVLVPRLVLGLGDGWVDTTVDLGPGAWRNAMTGDRIGAGALRLDQLFARFPVALLVADGAVER